MSASTVVSFVFSWSIVGKESKRSQPGKRLCIVELEINAKLEAAFQMVVERKNNYYEIVCKIIEGNWL